VVSVGGTIERAPGSHVDGEIVEVSFWQGIAGGWGWGPTLSTLEEHRYDYFDGALGDLIRALVMLAVLLLVAALVSVIGRGGLERVAAQIAWEPWKAAVVGLLAIILFVPLAAMVAVLLAVSVIGIPLLLLWPFAVLACLFAAFFGYLAAAEAVGRWSERRFGWRLRRSVNAVLMGLFLVHAPWILARIIDVGDSAHDFAGFLVVTLWLFWFSLNLALLVVGTGGVMLGRKGGPAPAVVPPVPPQPPIAGPGAPLLAAAAGGAAATGAASYAATAPAATGQAAMAPPVAPAADTGAVVEEEEWEQRSWDEPFAPFEERGTVAAGSQADELAPGPGEAPGDEPAGDELADDKERDRP
jgi:hypothetical protein